MTGGHMPMCEGCVHRTAKDRARNDGYSCSAYPDRIPEEIVLNSVDHRKPHKGDHGIQFEPTDGTSAAYAASLFE